MDSYLAEGMNFVIDSDILSAAMEIMTVTIRMCFDLGTNEFLRETELHFSYNCKLYKIVKGQVSSPVKFLHHLNSLEVLKYRILANELMLIDQFKEKLLTLYSEDFEAQLDDQTKDYIEYLILEVLIKCLKAGNNEVLTILKEHIPKAKFEQIAAIVESSTNNRYGNSANNQQSIT